MRSKTISLLAAAMMALAFVAIGIAAPPPPPANFTVGTCASPSFPTIQAAVNAAGPGAKITVCPGTYVEQVTVPAGKNNLVLQSKTLLTAIIQAPAAMSAPKAIVRIQSTNVGLTGFTIQGPGGGPCGSIEYGVRVDGGGSATIERNHIAHIRDNPLSGCQNGNAIQVGRAADSTTGSATIRENAIDDYQKSGIVVSNTGSRATIEHNWVQGVGPTAAIAQNGIQVSSGAEATIRENIISGNLYSQPTNASTGILLFAPGATNVENNYVSTNDVDIYVYQATAGVTIKHNDTSRATYDGIDLLSSSGVRVEDNKSHDNGSNGIYANDTGTGNTLKNNETNGNGDDGIYLEDADNNTLSKNTANENDRDGLHAGPTSTGNKIDENNAKTNTQFDCHDESTGAGTAGTRNTWTKDKGVTRSPNGICKP